MYCESDRDSASAKCCNSALTSSSILTWMVLSSFMRYSVLQGGTVSTTNLMANKKRILYSYDVDEGRKRTLGVIAAIFLCRKLAALDGRPSPARQSAFADSISLAEELMRRIDAKWPRDKVPGRD